MSRSFLIESLLMKDACRRNCSSKHSVLSDATVTVTQSTTNVGPQNDKLNAGMTSRNTLLNAVADRHTVANCQMMQHHCSQTAPELAAAVDVYLQSLTSMMHTVPPPSVRQMMTGGCLTDTHRRLRSVYDVPQSLKLTLLCRQQLRNHHNHDHLRHHHQHHTHHHQQQQQRCSAHWCGGSLTSAVSLSTSHRQCWPITPKAEIAGVGSTFVNDNQSKMTDMSCVTESTIHKRMRTAFTSCQLMELERQFAANMYLSRLRRIEISARLQLSEKQIKIWYQNRRVRYKKESITQDNGDVCRDDDVSGSESLHCACPLRTCCRRSKDQRQ